MRLWPWRRTVRVPADDGCPNDLPAWARDELVRLRLEVFDLQVALDVAKEARQKAALGAVAGPTVTFGPGWDDGHG